MGVTIGRAGAPRTARGRALDIPLTGPEAAPRATGLTSRLPRRGRCPLPRSDTLPALLRDLTHELRNPLAGIVTAAEALSVVDAEGERRELVTMILRETGRLERLVTNILDMSRLDGGALVPQPDWCSPEELVGGAVRDCGAALDGAGLTIDLAPAPELVRADPVLTERILVNLLENAVRHGAPPVAVTGRVDGDHYEIEVRDGGPGVDPEVLPSVFEPFVHREGEGLGLGLPLCRRLASAQACELSHRPTPSGACFVLRVPSGAPA